MHRGMAAPKGMPGLPETTLFRMLCFLSLLVLLLLWENGKLRRELEWHRLQLEIKNTCYEAYEELIQTVRERQHDFRNHLNAMEGMLYTIHDHDELVLEQRKYMDSLSEDMETVRILTMVECPPIAGFLTYKITEAKKQGIRVRYDCVMSRDSGGFCEYNLVEMMGILLDNAMEELAKETMVHKLLKLELSVENDCICFAVTNSCGSGSCLNISQCFKAGYSSKGRGRGLGLPKLKCLVKEANGEIFITEESYQDIPMIRIEWKIPVR